MTIHTPAKRTITRWLLWQAAVVVVASSLCFALAGGKAAYSAVLGALTVIIPGGVFAYLFLRKTGAQASQQIIMNLYLGEVIKMLLTMMLLVVMFIWVTIAPWALLVGFIFAQLSYWLALWSR